MDGYYGSYGSGYGSYSGYGSGYGGYSSSYSSPSYSSSSPDGFWTAIVGIGIFTWVIMIVCVVLILVAMWKIFKKAGYEGWESLITGHKEYVLFQMAGIEPAWILLEMFFWPSAIVFCFWKNIGLAHNFGKSTAFGIGLSLLPVVFYPILGFGNSEFMGNTQRKNMWNPNNQYGYGYGNLENNNMNSQNNWKNEESSQWPSQGTSNSSYQENNMFTNGNTNQSQFTSNQSNSNYFMNTQMEENNKNTNSNVINNQANTNDMFTSNNTSNQFTNKDTNTSSMANNNTFSNTSSWSTPANNTETNQVQQQTQTSTSSWSTPVSNTETNQIKTENTNSNNSSLSNFPSTGNTTSENPNDLSKFFNNDNK